MRYVEAAGRWAGIIAIPEEDEMSDRDVSRRGTGTRGPGGIIGIVVGSRGIEWVCWGRPGETVAEWQARFRAMCAAFDEAV